MGPLKPFFHLTSSFFGLTSNYKVPLLEEVHILTEHKKNFTYSDVMAMPTYERRFFIGLLTRDAQRREEQVEQMREKQKQSTGKGSRSTRVSGAALKNKIKNGDIPNK